jgi:RNA polymerase sigma factor (sigma-70 family)
MPAPDFARLLIVPRTDHSTKPATRAAIRVSTRSLLERYRLGKSSRALEILFEREIPDLRRWARGRLPRWARSLIDTGDLVQDALARTVPHLSRFEPRHEKALQAYLRNAVQNRIRDELRHAGRTPQLEDLNDAAPEGGVAGTGLSPLETLLQDERHTLFTRALARLNDADRTVVVARLQLGYAYDQIALMMGKRSADSARMAVTRAIERLGHLLTELASSGLD